MGFPGTDGLILHYEVNSKTGNVIYDLSNNGYDIGHAHAYKVVYIWADDLSACTAAKKCDCGNVIAEETALCAVSDRAVTCTTDGKKEARAVFSADWAENQTKIVTTEATGHNKVGDVCTVCDKTFETVEIPLGAFGDDGFQRSLIAVPYPGATLTITVNEGYLVQIHSGSSYDNIDKASGWLSGGTYTLPEDSIYMRVCVKNADGPVSGDLQVESSDDFIGLAVSYESASNIVTEYEALINDVTSAVTAAGSAKNKTVLVHLSDIHGDVVRVQRAVEFANEIEAQQVIMTGGLSAYDHSYFGQYSKSALNRALRNYDKANTTNRIMYILGDHDADGLTGKEQSNVYGSPVAANGAASISALNLKVIYVSQYYNGNTYSVAQIKAIISAMKSTNANYGVVLMYNSPEHPDNHILYQLVDAFIQRKKIDINYGGESIPADFTGDNVKSGVEFIAHITGHTHQDFVGYVSGTQEKQLMLTAPSTSAYQDDPSGLIRGSDDASQDAFNTYVIDRVNKTVQVYRIGAKETTSGTVRDDMTIHYVESYQVTWKNADGSVLKTERVAKDLTPTYTGETPTKAAEGHTVYTFSGWNTTPAAVTGDVTYTAQYTETQTPCSGGEETCTEQATCEICGEKYGETLGHDMVTDAAVAATCTETGLTEGSHCSRCNDATIEQSVVPALGHDIVTDAAVAATCTETGLTEGSHCSRCNDATIAQEVIPALGHTEEAIPAVDATCTTAGSTAGVKCSVCDAVITAPTTTNALGHSYDNGVVTTAPNCTAAGVKTYTCTADGCGATYTEEIAATGKHEWTDGKCGSCGTECEHSYENGVCTECGGHEVVTVSFTVKHNLNMLDLVQIGYWITATPNSADIQIKEYGILVWDEEAYHAETDFTINSENAYKPKLKLVSGYMRGYGEGVYAQFMDTKYYAIPYVVTTDGRIIYSSEVDIYSVPQYALEPGFLASNDQYLKNVVYDLLNYATYAQYYFYEKSPDLDVSSITPINSVLAEQNRISNFEESMKIYVPNPEKDTNKSADCEWLFTTTNLEEAVLINYFATYDGRYDGMLHWTQSDYETAGELKKGTESSDLDVIRRSIYGKDTTTGRIINIYAKNIYDWQYACMYIEDEGNYLYGTLRVDSVAAYLTRAINGTDANKSNQDRYFVEMCKNMLAYGQSAKEYAETRN